MTLDRSIPPQVNPMPEMTMPQPDVTVTASGARLYTFSGGDAPVTRIQLSLGSGLLTVPSPELGALLPPLWIEGTPGMDADAIADFFDYRGAWIKSDMSIYSLNLTVNALNANVAETIPVIGRILSSPTFPADRLQHLASLTESQLRVEQANASWHAASALRNLIYGPGHPLARNASPDLIPGVTSALAAAYYDSIIRPGNLTVFLSGRLDDSTVDAVTKMIDSLPGAGGAVDDTVPPFMPADDHRVHVDLPESRQSSVKMGLILPGRDNPDFIPLRLLIFALGGYFGSRLMMNVREDKGYTYGINAYLLGYRHRSYMAISSETDAAYVTPLIDETLKEIERMKDPASYSTDEIERLRRISLSALAAMLDTPFTIMDHHRASLQAGAPADYFALQQQAILNLTPDSLAALARKYFDTSSLYIATAGR